MKKIKLLALTIIALTIVGFTDVKAQEFVMIRAYEAIGGSNSKMITTTSDGNSVETELNMGIIKKAKENSSLIHNEIDSWVKKGFSLKHLAVVEVERIVITTYILEK